MKLPNYLIPSQLPGSPGSRKSHNYVIMGKAELGPASSLGPLLLSGISFASVSLYSACYYAWHGSCYSSTELTKTSSSNTTSPQFQ